ncbi:MAG: hypothetical protein AAF677_00770 [Pseudomonadota bacterium]
MMGGFLFRVRTLLVLARTLQVRVGTGEMAALAHLCRQLRPLGANPVDAAIGYVIAARKPADPKRLQSALDRTALPATRDQLKRHLKKDKRR